MIRLPSFFTTTNFAIDTPLRPDAGRSESTTFGKRGCICPEDPFPVCQRVGRNA